MNVQNIRSIFFKELRGYFYSLSSYLFIIVYLSTITWLFFQDLFLIGEASMRQFFSLTPWFFLFLVPALSMRIWAEEKRQGTLEALLTLPVHEWEYVATKFFAGFAFLGAALLLSLPIPVTLGRIGDIDLGQVFSSYIAAWFFGGALLSLGQYISSLTKNQIVAFLLSIASATFFIFIGLPFVLARAGAFSSILYTFSVLTHYENMIIGVVDSRDVLYFSSFIGIFLYLNVYSLMQRHWK